MDSGNSGSMSSSGGEDQDLDIVSRQESVSGFFNSSMQFSDNNNNNPNLQFSQFSNQQQLYDLPSTYLQALSSTQSQSTSNLNILSRPNTGSGHQLQQPNSIPDLPGSSSSSHHQLAPSISLPRGGGYSAARAGNLVNRNSKKRTRASRRAPTTVLTTDTSNFRAMVQEFTGIPAPPFSGGSSAYSRRLESMFGGSGSGSGSGSIYPLRPSAQKVHHIPFLSSNNSLLTNSTSVSMQLDANSINSSTSTSSHHDMNNFNFTPQGLIGSKHLLPHPHPHPHHNHNMMTQNPILSAFYNQEHQPQPPPFLSSFGAKPQPSSTGLPLHYSLEDQLGMSRHHGYLNTNLGAAASNSDGSSSTMLQLPLRNDDNQTLRWRDHHHGLLGLGTVDSEMRPNNLDHHHGNMVVSSSRSNMADSSWISPNSG